MSSSDLPGSADVEHADAWAALLREADERYCLLLERKDFHGEVRYVAIARSLDVRPYAVVTTDLDELREAIGQRDTRSFASEARPRSSEEATLDAGSAPLTTPGGVI
jgi:hypothetical protein